MITVHSGRSSEIQFIVCVFFFFKRALLYNSKRHPNRMPCVVGRIIYTPIYRPCKLYKYNSLYALYVQNYNVSVQQQAKFGIRRKLCIIINNAMQANLIIGMFYPVYLCAFFYLFVPNFQFSSKINLTFFYNRKICGINQCYYFT